MIHAIKKGLKRYKEEIFPENQALYNNLANSQHPHTLFITCSDSRISIERLLDSKPGDVFVLRNVANLVPDPASVDQGLTSMASVEFAIKVLKVKQVIICGHSNCGGCASVLKGLENISHLPFTKAHLQSLEQTKNKVLAQNPTNLSSAMEQANVVQQVNNLKQHHFVRQRMDSGALEIIGMHYSIGEGEVRVYSEESGVFQTV